MRCAQAVFLILSFAACAGRSAPASHAELGRRALEHTRAVVALGPRPAGSEANRKQQAFIADRLEAAGCELKRDAFSAHTPLGPREMENIVCELPGTSGRILAVSGHYDTFAQPGLHFVGANDGGSSTGLLLALAELLSGRERKDTIRLIFFDGEEAVVAWQDGDHTYGSGRMAAQWAADGTAEKLVGLINVDMIGDADLELLYEGNSTPWLRDAIVSAAHRLGYAQVFPRTQPRYVEDDHIPFLQRGMPAANLIDFDYGLYNSYWHTDQDTIDKLSAESFATVLHVLDETIRELEKRP